MPKPKRNDPCPCGSGKKYKNCCMQQDRVAESRDLHLEAEDATLLNALYEFAQSRRFLSDIMPAFDIYWGGSYALGGGQQLDTDDMRRMMEWFVHDYHTARDKKRVIELYIEERTAEFPAEVVRILEGWASSIMGVFRVLETHTDDTLLVLDPLRERELVLRNAMLARNAKPGELIVGRMFERDGVNQLTLMAMLLPADFEPGLVEFVTNAYGLYADQHYQATWDDFMRESGHIINAYLVSAKADALRSLIGPGTRYHDPAITRDKLREFAKARAAEQRELQRAQQAPRRQAVRRTGTGIIVPGAGEPPKPAADAGADEAKRPTILIPGRDS